MTTYYHKHPKINTSLCIKLLLLLIVFGQYEPCSKLVDTALVLSY